MLTEYIERAMRKAKYKKLADGTYCGTIRPCPGAIAFGKTLRECKREMLSVLEDWLLVKLRHGDPLPTYRAATVMNLMSTHQIDILPVVVLE